MLLFFFMLLSCNNHEKGISVEKWNVSSNSVYKNLLTFTNDTLKLPPFNPQSHYGKINSFKIINVIIINEIIKNRRRVANIVNSELNKFIVTETYHIDGFKKYEDYKSLIDNAKIDIYNLSNYDIINIEIRNKKIYFLKDTLKHHCWKFSIEDFNDNQSFNYLFTVKNKIVITTLFEVVGGELNYTFRGCYIE